MGLHTDILLGFSKLFYDTLMGQVARKGDKKNPSSTSYLSLAPKLGTLTENGGEKKSARDLARV